jgi:hypothetical protein
VNSQPADVAHGPGDGIRRHHEDPVPHIYDRGVFTHVGPLKQPVAGYAEPLEDDAPQDFRGYFSCREAVYSGHIETSTIVSGFGI